MLDSQLLDKDIALDGQLSVCGFTNQIKNTHAENIVSDHRSSGPGNTRTGYDSYTKSMAQTGGSINYSTEM